MILINYFAKVSTRSSYGDRVLFIKGIPFISKTTYLERLKRHSSDHQQKANRTDNASQQTTTMNQPDADQRMAGFSQVIW